MKTSTKDEVKEKIHGVKGGVKGAGAGTDEQSRLGNRLLGQWRGTQRYDSIQRAGEKELTAPVIALGSQYGRYGYRKIAATAADGGRDRMEGIWKLLSPGL